MKVSCRSTARSMECRPNAEQLTDIRRCRVTKATSLFVSTNTSLNDKQHRFTVNPSMMFGLRFSSGKSLQSEVPVIHASQLIELEEIWVGREKARPPVCIAGIDASAAINSEVANSIQIRP